MTATASPARPHPLSGFRRFWRHTWLSRLPLVGRLRDWLRQVRAARERSRLPRPSFQPELFEFEGRFMPNDMLGTLQVPLYLSGVVLLDGSLPTPQTVLARGWSGGRAQPTLPPPPESGTLRTGLGDTVSAEGLAPLSWLPGGSPASEAVPAAPEQKLRDTGPVATGMQPLSFNGLPQTAADFLRNPLGDDWLTAVGAALGGNDRGRGLSALQRQMDVDLTTPPKGGGPGDMYVPAPGVNASIPPAPLPGSGSGAGAPLAFSLSGPGTPTAPTVTAPLSPVAAVPPGRTPVAPSAAPADTTFSLAAPAADPAITGTGSTTTNSSATVAALMQNGGPPLAFEPNVGQTDPQARFLSHGPGFGLFLTDTGAVFSFARATNPTGRDVAQMQLAGATPGPQAYGVQQLTSFSNYFSGSDPSQWLANVPNYGEIDYRNVYPGIDLHYHSVNGRQLEYDFVVQPGVNPSAIQLSWQGVQSLSLDGQGNLVLTTAGGSVVQQEPVVYQAIHGVRQAVTSQQVLLGNGKVGFQVGAYDPSQPLVIDPTLAFSTYLGGSGNDYANGIAVDGAGDAYVTGVSNSTNFPTTTGFAPGSSGALFVTKLNAAGTGLAYSDFLSSQSDQANGIAVDLAGDAYITGATGSPVFPVTPGAFQTSYGGMPHAGRTDAFVTKLSATGDALLYSTYLEGGGRDQGNAIAVDLSGNAYVTGLTTSGSFPTTAEAYQTSLSGSQDAFVTKLNPQGSALAYSTYLGAGSDSGTGLAVDPAGNAYVSGSTSATNFPTTSGAYQTAWPGGTQAAFVAKLNAAGTALSYSTYLGGSGSDQANAIAVNSAGGAYVTGSTTSSNFPTTSGAYQTAWPGGTQAAFVSKLNAAGSGLAYSTYLGGGGTDVANGIGIDSQGEALVAGATSSTNFPTTSGAFQTSNAGGTEDAFVTKLNSSGSALGYSSYLGGSGDDKANGIAVDPVGYAYVAGSTNSTNFPTVSPAYQGSNAGGYDAFVAKVLSRPVPPAFTGISPSAAHSADFGPVTTYQYLQVTGTASANATVTLYQRGVGLIDTVTANSSGLWTSSSYNNSPSGPKLPEGVAAFVATQTASGLTSDFTSEYFVTVDETAPTLTVVAPSSTASLKPQARVTASDLNGLPNGTTATLQVYNSSGTTLLSSTTGSLTNGTVVITVGTALTAGTSYLFKGQVTDLAGNVGTSAGQSVSITSATSWSVTSDQELAADPLTGQAQEQLGNVSVQHALDLDQSPGTAQGGNPNLVYNSDSVSVQPFIQATLQSSNNASLPASIPATLTWDRGGTPTVTTMTYNTTGAYQGDVLTVTAQVSAAVTTTKRYAWELDLGLPGGTQALTGTAYVVAQDSSPLGAGWAFSPVDRLVSIAADSYGPAGMLRVYGTGGYRFYQGTTSFTSPPGDNGTLTLSGGTYTYTTADGQKTTFNSNGYETSWASADGQQTLQFRYDGSNRLTGMTAIDGALTTISYGTSTVTFTVLSRTTTLSLDSSGNLTQVTNPDGGVHTFAYDSGHRVTGETFANLQNEWAYTSSGTLGTFTWGSATSGGQSNPSNTVVSPIAVQGLVAASATGNAADGTAQATDTDPDGHKTLWQLDSVGRPLQQVAGDGGVTAWTYSNGYVSTETDPLGRTTTYARDSAGYVTQETLPDGSTQSYQYLNNGFHSLATFTNERGYSTTYSYDSQGHQTTQTNALGQTTSYAYSASGLQTTVTDPLGHTSSYAYDSDRRLTAATDPLGDVTTYTYDSNGNQATVTDARGDVTTTSYDVMGRLTAQTDALGNTSSYTYNGAGLQLTSTDAAAVQSSTVYDAFNRGLGAQAISGVGTQVQQDNLSSYDAAGQSNLARNPDGWSTTTAYDPVGRQQQTTNAQSGQTQTYYDLAGQVLATRDELGRLTQHAYNLRGWETQTIDPLGDITTTAYDAVGNKTAVTDPLNHTTTYQYNQINQRTAVVDAVGNRTTTTYDAAGNTSTVTDPLNHVTSYGYDAANRRTITTQAVGTTVQRTLQTGYDKVGNATTQTDGLGHTMTTAYDKDNRATAVTDALGHTSTTAYDQVGNSTAQTDALSQTSSYAYDALDRQVATTDALSHTSTTILDPVGNQVATQDPLNNVSQNIVDSLGQTIRPPGRTERSDAAAL
jgi:YD repeat-containing protein